jgi:hypothetical protein
VQHISVDGITVCGQQIAVGRETQREWPPKMLIRKRDVAMRYRARSMSGLRDRIDDIFGG